MIVVMSAKLCVTEVVFERRTGGLASSVGRSVVAGTEIWIMLDKYDSSEKGTLIDLSSSSLRLRAERASRYAWTVAWSGEEERFVLCPRRHK